MSWITGWVTLCQSVLGVCVCVWPWPEEVLSVIRDVVTTATTAGMMKSCRWPSAVPTRGCGTHNALLQGHQGVLSRCLTPVLCPPRGLGIRAHRDGKHSLQSPCVSLNYVSVSRHVTHGVLRPTRAFVACHSTKRYASFPSCHAVHRSECVCLADGQKWGGWFSLFHSSHLFITARSMSGSRLAGDETAATVGASWTPDTTREKRCSQTPSRYPQMTSNPTHTHTRCHNCSGKNSATRLNRVTVFPSRSDSHDSVMDKLHPATGRAFFFKNKMIFLSQQSMMKNLGKS